LGILARCEDCLVLLEELPWDEDTVEDSLEVELRLELLRLDPLLSEDSDSAVRSGDSEAVRSEDSEAVRSEDSEVLRSLGSLGLSEGDLLSESDSFFRV